MEKEKTFHIVRLKGKAIKCKENYNANNYIVPGLNRGTHEITSSKVTNSAVVVVIGIIFVVLFVVLVFYVIRGEGDDPLPPPPDVIEQKETSTIGASKDGSFLLDNGDAYTDSVSCRKGDTRTWGHDSKFCNSFL